MRLKILSIITIIIIISNTLIIGWNFKLNADSFNTELTNISTSISISNPRALAYEWGEIEVISEPLLGQNNNMGYSFTPKIAIENDKIYVVWVDNSSINGAGTDGDIFYRYFNGSKWSEIQVISEPIIGQNSNIGDCADPNIAVEDSKIYVVWQDQNNTNGAGTDADIFYRCNLTGIGWGDIQVISEPVPGFNFNVGGSYGASITVENGKIYTTWNDRNNTDGAGTDNDIFFRCNLIGYSWEPIQVISEPAQGKNFNVGNSYGPRIAVESNKIYVVWTDENNTNNAGIDYDIFYRCNLSGINWEDIQVVSESTPSQNYNTGDSFRPLIAIENGKIYTVWEDNDNTNNAGVDGEILYRCNLTGFSWEPVQVISEPVQGKNLNGGKSYSSEIAVENGKIYIVWSDESNFSKADTDYDIFYRTNFTGFCWEPIRVISEPIMGSNLNNEFSGAPDIAVNNGKVYVVWDDRTNFNGASTDFDIFYRYIYSPLVLNLPNVTPTRGNTSTDFNFTIIYTHLNNATPIEITLNISGNRYSMLEVNPNDIDYLDNKNYFFNIKNLQIGVHTCIFQASDGKFTWLSMLVNKPIVYNIQPNITTENNLTAIEDVYYEVDYDYEDIDLTNIGQSGTWNFSTNAEWLTFDKSSAILNGTPTNDDVGKYWVNISIDDSINSDFTNFTLNVVNVNDAPIIITDNIKLTKEDEYYENYYEAIDVDLPQDSLFWNMQTNASWLKFSSITAELRGIPTNDDVGEYWINISVSDNESIDFSNFTLKVVNTNDPPTITTKDKTNATVGELYSINYEAVDIDPPPITLTWYLKTNTSDWLSIDPITGWVTGIPSVEDIGTYWINISVTDGESGWDHNNFTLKVLKLPIQKNNAPELSNATMTPSEGNIETSFTFSIYYYDMNGDIPNIIQVVIDEIPRNLKLRFGENASNGIYYYKTTLAKGTHTYYFIASDGLETVKTKDFTTSEIKQLNEVSKEITSWYWLIWVVIFIIIIFLLGTKLFLYKKRKAVKIPVVKAELMKAVPKHLALPGEISGGETVEPILIQHKILEQLPAPKVQIQPTSETASEKIPMPSLAPAPVLPQYQLPKATLSKEQQLGLLRERFLRGEIIEETYKKLRAEIEGIHDGDITIIKEELKEDPIDIPQLQPKHIEIPMKSENVGNKLPETALNDNTPQQLESESGQIISPPQAEVSEVTVPLSEQPTQELLSTNEKGKINKE